MTIDPNNSGHADLVSANGNGGLSPKGSDVTVLRNLTGDTGSATSTTTISRTNGTGPVNYGQEVDFLATVTGDGSENTPTGTVVFTVNGSSFDKNCDNVPLTKVDNNTAVAPCNTILLPVGNPGVVATYSGDSYYAMGTPTSPLNQEVDKATPTDVVTSDINPSTYGQLVTFTATVAGANGATQPTGTVAFFDGGAPISSCSAQPLTQNGTTNSTATCAYSGLDTGAGGLPHNITAPYTPAADDPNYLAAPTSPPYSQQVNKATPTNMVSADINPSTYGQQVTFTATVAGASGFIQPTGTVAFFDGGAPISSCSAQPLTQNGTTNSTATCAYSGLDTGAGGAPHRITATYNPSGDPLYTGPVTSPVYLQQVNKATPMNMVSADINPSTYGQLVTFTATVAGVSGFIQPTGTVAFFDGATLITSCSAQPLTQNGTTNSTATCAYSGLDTGAGGAPHRITATYNPGSDPNYTGPATSPVYLQQVNKATPSNTVTSDINPSTYGQLVTFTAAVAGVSGVTQPTGTVAFFDGGAPISSCSAQPLTQNGTTNSTATCAYSGLDTGAGGAPHRITATYNPSGDPNYFTFTSPVYSQQVNKATPTNTVSADINPSTYGQQVTFTETVAGASGLTQPTGTVDFYDGATKICPDQPLTQNGTTNSTAICKISTLDTGANGAPHSITATYNPGTDPYYIGNTSPIFSQSVLKATTTIPPVVLTKGMRSVHLRPAAHLYGDSDTPVPICAHRDGDVLRRYSADFGLRRSARGTGKQPEYGRLQRFDLDCGNAQLHLGQLQR